MTESAILALEDGTVFRGRSIGAAGYRCGEVVFNTAITGYQEVLTDPSYCRQIVTLTYPHIGNVGVNPQDAEAAQIFAAGLVVRDYPGECQNWRATQTLAAYLAAREIVAIADIDTRKLTRLLRTGGALAGCISSGDGLSVADAVAEAGKFPGLKGLDLAREVTTDQPYQWTQGGWTLHGYPPAPAPCWKVIAYDFGIKRNILRLLVEHGCAVEVVPAMHEPDAVIAANPDGVFLSNGPGDPAPCQYAISAIKKILSAGIPVFGICLGYQLLALACGAQTEKMKFGHHGANHPVQDLETGRVWITSQNHGFAVAEASLPRHLIATHRSLFDGTLQGVRHAEQPAFGFQGHPEASPGPHDVRHLFDSFVAQMANYRAAA